MLRKYHLKQTMLFSGIYIITANCLCILLYSYYGVATTELTSSFFRFTKDFWVFYGLNTELFQCGSEFKSKMPIAIPWKFTAKINVREKKFELDFPPCKKEFELFSIRYVLNMWGKK